MTRIALQISATKGMCGDCIYLREPDDTPDYYCDIFREHKPNRKRLKVCIRQTIRGRIPRHIELNT